MKAIFYVHRGNSFFLHLSIEQAHKMNPQIPIVLLGDETNRNIAYAKHFYIKDFMQRASQLAQVYKHASPNGYDYELFCFQRWFVIWEFMQQHPDYDDRFAYFDSDTLIFDNINDRLEDSTTKEDFKSSNISKDSFPRLALENGLCPAFSFFERGTIGELCDVIESIYTKPEGMRYWEHFVEKTRQQHAVHGFSDMYAIEYYCQQIRPGETVNIDIPIPDASGQLVCYDQNISLSDGFQMTNQGYKQFNWHEGNPYGIQISNGEEVRFRGIHFQGRSKFLMAYYTHTPFYKLKGHWIKDFIKYMLRNIV